MIILLILQNQFLNQRKFTGDGNFEKYRINSSEYSLILSGVLVSEVSKILNKFDSTKACGPTSIPIDLLKYLDNEISHILTQLINLSFESGTHPEKLKIAKVIPIFKKGSKLKASNYRPISLLSNINKLFEKVMYIRLLSFLNDQNSFYKLQYGFRAKHSTEHALINLSEQIKESLDTIGNSKNRKYACGIFNSFSKSI